MVKIYQKSFFSLQKELPDFGKTLARDGKAISIYGKKSKKIKKDGRRDLDADFGKFFSNFIEGFFWVILLKHFLLN
ncbi:MAG: hypothetical protein AMS24_05240 [Chlamydiae bacterium SM23_39]|nr:MAG: hypothetical protein AMS24_05240 [Chlamydiae bacterium SM23_39]